VKDLGLIAYLQDDYAAARPYFEESLALSRQIANKDNQIEALNYLGDLARCQGDFQQAEALYTENLVTLHKLKIKRNIASTLHNLGYVALHQRDHQKAAGNFRESLALFQEQDDKKGVAECLEGLAGVLAIQGGTIQAATLFGAAEAAREALGVKLWPANRIAHDEHVSLARANSDPATFEAAWTEGRSMTLEQAVAFARHATGIIMKA
jgi:tetratricopeptide (TPR) repeat protein